MMKKNKPINMATGGLMNMPPFIKKSEEEKEQGITAYDVNTPKEARQGLPSRLLAPSRTRFESGDSTDLSKNPNYKGWKKLYEKNPDVAEMNDNHSTYLAFYNSQDKDKKAYGGLMRKKYNKGDILDLDGSGDTTMKDVLIGRGVIDADGNMISKNKKAYGGLMRKKYAVGDEVDDNQSLADIIKDLEPLEEAPAEGDIPGETKNQSTEEIENMISRLEAEKKLSTDMSVKSNIDNQIDKLKTLRMRKVRAATGGLLQLSIGGEAGLSEKYDRRRDYQAYAEGDMVEDETLMSPPDMNPMTETNMEMEAEDDMGDMDGVVDTSALSEEEEKVVDDAVEMFPELEAIIPKIVATEFTEDGEVEGPGTGTSDSIPALLSDGEFVFTAKAVKHIGVDKLRKMMKDAEAAYDSGMQSQEADAAMAE
jgi:hypothetical protein